MSATPEANEGIYGGELWPSRVRLVEAAFRSFPPFPSQRRGMPYRGGQHTHAEYIAALGGESNYVTGPRRRRSRPSLHFPADSYVRYSSDSYHGHVHRAQARPQARQLGVRPISPSTQSSPHD